MPQTFAFSKFYFFFIVLVVSIITCNIDVGLRGRVDYESFSFKRDKSEEENPIWELNSMVTTLETEKFPKILEVTLDPKLTFTKHIDATVKKARPTTNILKALAGTDWGKTKETLANTYKIYSRPILEYASSTWCSIVSKKQMQRLQTIQNTALRIATGFPLFSPSPYLLML